VVAEHLLDERGVDVREPAPSGLGGPRQPDPTGPPELERDLSGVPVREHPLPPPLRVRVEARPELLGERGSLLAELGLRRGGPEVHVGRS
jgi:hypothetical protein